MVNLFPNNNYYNTGLKFFPLKRVIIYLQYIVKQTVLGFLSITFVGRYNILSQIGTNKLNMHNFLMFLKHGALSRKKNITIYRSICFYKTL